MEMAESELNDRNAPVCSVCIANYNGLNIIAECIESVLAQDCGFPIEIIVHDDASTDGSAEFIRDRFPQVKLIESRENVGFCISNNRMAVLASGKYLLLLNNDATLMREALATLLKKAISIGSPAILSLPQYDAESSKIIDIGCLLDPFLNPVPNLNLEKNDVGMVIGACFWIPRELWNKLGGFPEWFGSLAEDMYLCSAARLTGYPVIVATESGYLHQVGHSFGGGKATNMRLTLSKTRRRLSERNKNFVMLLSYPWSLLWIIFPLHILLLLLEGILLSAIKRDLDILSSIYWGSLIAIWQYRKKLLTARNRLQRLRRVNLKTFVQPYIWFPYKLSLLFKYGLPK